MIIAVSTCRNHLSLDHDHDCLHSFMDTLTTGAVASIITLSLAVIGGCVASLTYVLKRRMDNAAQWWARAAVAIDKATSSDYMSRMTGTVMLDHLVAPRISRCRHQGRWQVSRQDADMLASIQAQIYDMTIDSPGPILENTQAAEGADDVDPRR